ncbi:hypothetical protein H632_c1744p0, partial [Helicosporidium sp. ATCC 50920]
DAYYTQSNKVTNAINEKNPDRRDDIKNMPTNKTASLKMLNDYGKEKTFSHLCKEFTKEVGRMTIVGFGNWSNNDPGGIIKGHPVEPVKGFGTWLRLYSIVIYIDEHRTSMLYHVCNMKMVGQRVKIKDRDGKMQLQESYSGRYCKYCEDNNPEVAVVSAATTMPSARAVWQSVTSRARGVASSTAQPMRPRGYKNESDFEMPISAVRTSSPEARDWFFRLRKEELRLPNALGTLPIARAELEIEERLPRKKATPSKPRN